MKSVSVNTASRSYEVHVGSDILDSLGSVVRTSVGGQKAMLVSDSNVYPLYGRQTYNALNATAYEVKTAIIPAGEQSKNMTVLAGLLENIAAAGLTRDDVVVALGGGVVGDLAGFAAACYMRGCAVVQVPTSLLAMVDSSVGGKTAVDLAAGKNLAGAFWQPSAVIADVTCLSTLSPTLFSDSIGEIIKYGVLCDPKLFASLEERPLTLDDPQRTIELVSRCVEIKRDVVDADEREAGLRQTLNLGHTIGHAIEAESRYHLGHGSCVAAGLCCMARADAALGLCDIDTSKRISRLCAAHGLPTTTALDVDCLYRRSLADKKRHGNHINLVRIHAIGEVIVERVSLEKYRQILDLCR